MKNLYDKRLVLNSAGKELNRQIEEATKFIIDKWLKDGYNRHDIERVAITAINIPILIYSMRIQCAEGKKR